MIIPQNTHNRFPFEVFLVGNKFKLQVKET